MSCEFFGCARLCRHTAPSKLHHSQPTIAPVGQSQSHRPACTDTSTRRAAAACVSRWRIQGHHCRPSHVASSCRSTHDLHRLATLGGRAKQLCATRHFASAAFLHSLAVQVGGHLSSRQPQRAGSCTHSHTPPAGLQQQKEAEQHHQSKAGGGGDAQTGSSGPPRRLMTAVEGLNHQNTHHRRGSAPLQLHSHIDGGLRRESGTCSGFCATQRQRTHTNFTSDSSLWRSADRYGRLLLARFLLGSTAAMRPIAILADVLRLTPHKRRQSTHILVFKNYWRQLRCLPRLFDCRRHAHRERSALARSRSTKITGGECCWRAEPLEPAAC